MEVRITITDKGVTTEHGVTPSPGAAAPDPMPATLSGQTGMTASGAINAGPAPAALAAGGTGAPMAFITDATGVPGATAGAESAGSAPRL